MSVSPPPTPSRSLSLSGPSSSPAPLPSTRNNPISLRIYKALGTSFDDPSSREALEIASQFYASTSHQSEKGKGKVQNGGLDDDDDVRSEGGLNGQEDENGIHEEGELAIPKRRTLAGQTAAMARKHLKRDVERKLAGGSQKFLEAFGEVDKKLSVLREHMREMQLRCDQVQAELDQANSGTRYLLERADGLRSQRASAQLRSQIINLFLTRFTLSEVELSALTSRDIAVGQPVFDALDKVERIRKDCYTLLGGEEGTQQAGLDIMAATGEQMEAGYRKIHRWCQFEFRQFNKDGHLEVSQGVKEAVKRLKNRPTLLEDARQILTSTRAQSILSAFLEALTRGGPSGLPRPIELHAHDPTRYVGDMLAWVHQATASEHEFLVSLFGVKEGQRMVGSVRDVSEGKNEAGEMVRECLDKDLEGLGRPLKMRIQQTIKSQEGIIMAYKIANLLQFYLVTMRRTIGAEAGLTRTLQEIYDQSYATFLETLDAQGRSLLRFLHPPDATLSPPLALRDSAQILRDIISVYDSSLVDAEVPKAGLKAGATSNGDGDDTHADDSFMTLLGKAIDPAVEMCERMAEMRGGDMWDRDVFLINCLGYLQHTLEAYPFTAPRIARLGKQIQNHVESMTYEHHGKLLEQCGLAPIMRTIRNRPADTPLSRLPTTSPKSLSAALSTFSTFLTTIDVLSSPRLALLSSGQLAEQIHRTALKRIAQAYNEVCGRVLDKREGYEFGETLLRRSGGEVGVALGVGEGELEEGYLEEGEGIGGGGRGGGSTVGGEGSRGEGAGRVAQEGQEGRKGGGEIAEGELEGTGKDDQAVEEKVVEGEVQEKGAQE